MISSKWEPSACPKGTFSWRKIPPTVGSPLANEITTNLHVGYHMDDEVKGDLTHYNYSYGGLNHWLKMWLANHTSRSNTWHGMPHPS